jgi:hypothetical protein
VAQLLGQQEALVRPQPSAQRPLQRGALLPQAPLRQLGERFRVGGAGRQRLQDRPPRGPQHVAGHVPELEVGALQRLLHAVDLGCPLADERRAVARQLAQLPLRPLGHEAAPQQAVPQEVSQPPAVPHVGLAARHRLDVLGVGQQQGEAVLQQIPQRLPVDAGALHGHMGHAALRQPVAQGQQLLGRRPERAHLLGRLTREPRRDHARRGRPLVHVDPTAPLVQRLHLRPPPACTAADAGTAGSKSLLCVLPRKERQTVLPGGTRARLFPGSQHRWAAPATTPPLRTASVPHRKPIFICGAARQGIETFSLPCARRPTHRTPARRLGRTFPHTVREVVRRRALRPPHKRHISALAGVPRLAGRQDEWAIIEPKMARSWRDGGLMLGRRAAGSRPSALQRF